MTTGTIKKVVSVAVEEVFLPVLGGLTASLDFDRLAGGEKVQFDVEQGPKGARAKNVQTA